MHLGQKKGPYDVAMLIERNIKPHTPVWYEGLPDWTPAGQAAATCGIFGMAPHNGRPADRPRNAAEDAGRAPFAAQPPGMQNDPRPPFRQQYQQQYQQQYPQQQQPLFYREGRPQFRGQYQSPVQNSRPVYRDNGNGCLTTSVVLILLFLFVVLPVTLLLIWLFLCFLVTLAPFVLEALPFLAAITIALN